MSDKKLDTKKVKSEILLCIAERLGGHNFAGEILDDRWAGGLSSRAVDYLTDDERVALENLVEKSISISDVGRWVKQQSEVYEGAHVVLREFVLYLCGCYDIGPEDLARRGKDLARRVEEES